MRYCFYNNKGGVGKTLLTCLVASEYAIENSEKKVVVVDACPQANASEILLGGNGAGEENLEKCFRNGYTIAHYIKKRRRSDTRFGNEVNFFVPVNQYNDKMPPNLYLVPGDFELDICSTILNHMAAGAEKKAWQNSRNILNDLVSAFEESNDKQDIVVFFDCNPSFAPYTELAILACKRLIIPCTADAASLRGLRNVGRLIYGIFPDGSQDDGIFDTFLDKVREKGMINQLPKIHIVAQNRNRTHSEKSAIAFKANADRIKEEVGKMRERRPDIFSGANECVLEVKDGNTIAAVMHHKGLPLSAINPTSYKIYDRSCKITPQQRSAILEDVKRIVALI